MQCAHWYDQQRLFLAMLHLLQQQSYTVMFNIIVFKHFVFSWSVIALELQRSSSSPTPFLLHLWEAVSFTFWVRIQMSTFVQSEVPDNIFVVSILNSENQLVTIDLQFQKTLFALVCEDKNEQHKNPHCGVYMSFVRPHKSRPGHRALALHTDPRFVISCEVIQHQDLFSH